LYVFLSIFCPLTSRRKIKIRKSGDWYIRDSCQLSTLTSAIHLERDAEIMSRCSLHNDDIYKLLTWSFCYNCLWGKRGKMPLKIMGAGEVVSLWSK